MPVKDETVSDALLRKFLLGSVSEEERERIENVFLTDSQATERILVVEQELIEEYLEGNLTTADTERFVSHYAQTAEQRRNLRITKAIKDWAMMEASSTQTAPATVSTWSRLRARLKLKPAFVVPIAIAVVILIVVAVWLSTQTEERRRHLAIEQELAQLNTPSSQAPGPASIELSPVTVRGAGPASQLNTPIDKGVVELRLLWMQKERYSTYRAAIRRHSDNQLFTVPNLQPEADGKAVLIKLPAHILTKGSYRLDLSGISSDGSTGLLEEYSFIVNG